MRAQIKTLSEQEPVSSQYRPGTDGFAPVAELKKGNNMKSHSNVCAS